SVGFLCSAPWLVVASAFLVYHSFAESWVLWFLVGFVVAIIFVCLVTVRGARRAAAAQPRSIPWILRTRRNIMLTCGVLCAIVMVFSFRQVEPHWFLVFVAVLGFGGGCLMGFYMWEFRPNQGKPPDVRKNGELP